MDSAIIFVGVIVGAVIGHMAARLVFAYMDRRNRAREQERRAGLQDLKLEYAGKVSPSLIETVGHSPHSLSDVRRILDESIETRKRIMRDGLI